MSNSLKFVIPLLANNLTKEDFTKKTGFIGAYTKDPDNPTSFDSFYLAFDDRVRTDESQELARKLSMCRNVKKVYVKHVDSVPYLIYSFWIHTNIKNLFKDCVTISTRQKLRIANFWGADDDCTKELLNNFVFSKLSQTVMPLDDERRGMFESNVGLKITKGDSPKQDCHLYFFSIIMQVCFLIAHC